VPETIDVRRDPKCAELTKGGIKSDEVMVSSGGLADVVVYVQNPPAGTPEVPSAPVVLDQKGCRYTPKVFRIRAGQGLEIKNSDPTLHNIHAMAKRGEFNVAMPKQGEVVTRQFKKPEIVPIQCDVHPWMHALAAVTDHPFVAISGETGDYALPALPDGEYQVVAVHAKLGEKHATVTIHGAGVAMDFTYP
jgi:plastocyanin